MYERVLSTSCSILMKSKFLETYGAGSKMHHQGGDFLAPHGPLKYKSVLEPQRCGYRGTNIGTSCPLRTVIEDLGK